MIASGGHEGAQTQSRNERIVGLQNPEMRATFSLDTKSP
jgi:hypothetical protein